MKTQIKQIKVKIEPPKVQQITAESNPKVWALLQPPLKYKPYVSKFDGLCDGT